MKRLTLGGARTFGKVPTAWVSYDPVKSLWMMERDYSVEIKAELDGELMQFQVNIPKNFEFDLASVPRILWSTLALHELGIVAPLVHDYLYGNTGRYSPAASPLSRKAVDQVFRFLMQQENVATWRWRAAYQGVRLGGWTAWRRYAKANGV